MKKLWHIDGEWLGGQQLRCSLNAESAIAAAVEFVKDCAPLIARFGEPRSLKITAAHLPIEDQRGENE